MFSRKGGKNCRTLPKISNWLQSDECNEYHGWGPLTSEHVGYNEVQHSLVKCFKYQWSQLWKNQMHNSSFLSGSYLGFLNRTVRVSELQCNQNVRTLLVTNPHSAISKPGHTVCWPWEVGTLSSVLMMSSRKVVCFNFSSPISFRARLALKMMTTYFIPHRAVAVFVLGQWLAASVGYPIIH